MVDGRRARSERSKQAIIDASLALMEEGNLIPTAQQISDRAGVGIRSFFRHFEDMETLFATIDDQIRDNTEALFLGGDRDGTLEERILHAVERRAKGYEGIAPYKRAANVKRAHSEFLQERHQVVVSTMSKDLRRWFPELKRMNAATMHALELVTSFEAWDRLRVDQRLGKQRAAEAMKRAMSALLRARG